MSLEMRSHFIDVLGGNGVMFCPAYTAVAPNV